MTEEIIPEIEVQLSKELGLKEALGIAVGALIGGGIFSVLGLVIYQAGPAAFISFLMAGFVSSFTAYTYVHLALRYPKAGGAFIYVNEAFNSKIISGIVGIILWFGYNFSISLYAMTFGRYLGAVWPIFGDRQIPFLDISPSILVFEILSIVLFIVINLLGVKESSKTQNLLVLIKVSILVFYILAGLSAVKSSNFVPFAPNGVFPILASSVLIFVSMEGFEILSNSVEEMKEPERDLPLGMYLSIIIVLILYILVAVVTVGVLGYGPELKDYGEVILTHSANVFLGAIGGSIMAIAAIISAASAINATLLGSSRLSYMLSHEGIIPKNIAKINTKTRVPSRAILTSGFLSLLIILIFNIKVVATVASIIFMFIFAMVNISGIKILEGKKRIGSTIGILLIITYWVFWLISML